MHASPVWGPFIPLLALRSPLLWPGIRYCKATSFVWLFELVLAVLGLLNFHINSVTDCQDLLKI